MFSQSKQYCCQNFGVGSHNIVSVVKCLLYIDLDDVENLQYILIIKLSNTS